MIDRKCQATNNPFEGAYTPTSRPINRKITEGGSVLRTLFGNIDDVFYQRTSGNSASVSSASTSPQKNQTSRSILSPFVPDNQMRHNKDKALSLGQDVVLQQEDRANILTISALLELQESEHMHYHMTWDDINVSFHAVEYASGQVENRNDGLYANQVNDPVLHSACETLLVQSDNPTRPALQKCIEIVLRPYETQPMNKLIAVYIGFRELIANRSWTVSASCYVGLQASRKVLYPIRRVFSSATVDTTGFNSILFCSFHVNRTLAISSTSGSDPTDFLTHGDPSQEELEAKFRESDLNLIGDDISFNEVQETCPIIKSASHGMRPIGPHGRLMTRLQRQTLLTIRKRFQNQSSREWKKCLADEELFPLFTLGRDECAKEMGVCATWLKVRMRERGIKVWPNRKLLPTTCALFKLKKRLAEIKNMQHESNVLQIEYERGILEQEIEELRVQRMQIVRKSCALHIFTKFEAYAARIDVLDPDWVA
jgi:hypothetical protein